MRNIPEPFQKGKYWYAWMPQPDGTRKCRSTRETSKKYAKRRVRQWIEEFEAGHTEQSFREYAEPFFTESDPRIAWKRLRDKSVGESYRKACRARLVDHVFTDETFCRLPMRAITPRDCQQLFVRLEGRMGRRNILEKTRQTISVIFTTALDNDDIPKNPMRNLGTIDHEKKPHTILTIEALRSLFAEKPGVWKDGLAWRVFRLALLTGMRQGEILALQWRQVDLDAGKVVIDRAWKQKDEIGLPKWNKTREIPVSSSVTDILKEQQEESVMVGKEHLVFGYDDGSRLGITWWLKHFHDALEAKSIDWKARGIKPHGLRHAVNTYLLEAGANPILIDTYLGWSKHPPQLTKVQNMYTHPEMWDMSKIPETIEALFTPASDAPQETPVLHSPASHQ